MLVCSTSVMPVSTSEDAAPLAVIVFGLSPRLYWTEAYALFINLLTRQLSTGLSTVIGHEEEVALFFLSHLVHDLSGD